MNSNQLETEIRAVAKRINYDTTEYPIEILDEKWESGEIVLPDGMKETWNPVLESQFIESLLVGLPTLPIFLADVEEGGELVVIDGAQRILSIIRFLRGNLTLSGLELVESLNGTRYEHLPLSRQRRFNRISIRTVVVGGRGFDPTLLPVLIKRLNVDRALHA
jgi:hypothetical protein